jgi:hypothetical protein
MPDINVTSWDNERPIAGRLPSEVVGAFQPKNGAVKYSGASPDLPSADHLTVFWDEELLYVRDRLYSLYSLMFDPETCEAIYLDWLASLVGFADSTKDRYNGIGSGNPGDYNYVDHHDPSTLSGINDFLERVGSSNQGGFEDFRVVRSPSSPAEGGLRTNPALSSEVSHSPSFLSYPSYIHHDRQGEINSVPPPQDWRFKLDNLLWRSDYPEALKRWLVAHAFTKVWNYLGSNQLLSQIFERASLLVTITGDRFDWNVGTSRVGIDPLHEFVPYTYWLRVPTHYIRGQYHWQFVEFINDAFGSAICKSKVCYYGFYPDLSYPGEPPCYGYTPIFDDPPPVLQTLNISVSPVGVLEGSPIIQTLNISVSPIGVLEGSPISNVRVLLPLNGDIIDRSNTPKTFSNSTSPVTFSTLDPFGGARQSMVTSGSNGIVTISPDLVIPANTNFCIEGFVNFSTFGVSTGGQQSPQEQYLFDLDGNFTVGYRAAGSQTSWLFGGSFVAETTNTNSPIPNLNTWHFWQVQRSGSNISFYFNQALITTISSTSAIGNIGKLRIGQVVVLDNPAFGNYGVVGNTSNFRMTIGSTQPTTTPSTPF